MRAQRRLLSSGCRGAPHTCSVKESGGVRGLEQKLAQMFIFESTLSSTSSCHSVSGKISVAKLYTTLSVGSTTSLYEWISQQAYNIQNLSAATNVL